MDAGKLGVSIETNNKDLREIWQVGFVHALQFRIAVTSYQNWLFVFLTI